MNLHLYFVPSLFGLNGNEISELFFVLQHFSMKIDVYLNMVYIKENEAVFFVY